jgi:hypothetical protein
MALLGLDYLPGKENVTGQPRLYNFQSMFDMQYICFS